MSSNSKTARRRRRCERMWQRRDSFENSFQNLEQHAETAVDQLPPETLPEDLEVYRYDLLGWAQRFLPHHFKHPPSKMHIEIAAILNAEARRRDEELRAEAAKNAATSGGPGICRAVQGVSQGVNRAGNGK